MQDLFNAQSRFTVSEPITVNPIRKCEFRRRRTLIPKGTRTALRAEGEQSSERSDAGISIVQEVFSFLKGNDPERSGGRMPQAEKGCRERGGSSFLRLSNVETAASISSPAEYRRVFCAWNRRAFQCNELCERGG